MTFPNVKYQDVEGAVPHKITVLITFLPGYQRRFPAKTDRQTQTETQTQLINRLKIIVLDSCFFLFRFRNPRIRRNNNKFNLINL